NNKQPFPRRARWSDQSKAFGLNIKATAAIPSTSAAVFPNCSRSPRKMIAPGTAQSGIVYERIEDLPAGTMDRPNVISAITAAIWMTPTLTTYQSGLVWARMVLLIGQLQPHIRTKKI